MGNKGVKPRILLGAREICQHLGCSTMTLWRWRRAYGLPVTYRPNGQLMTSTTLLSYWVHARNLAIQEYREQLERERQQRARRRVKKPA